MQSPWFRYLLACVQRLVCRVFTYGAIQWLLVSGPHDLDSVLTRAFRFNRAIIILKLRTCALVNQAIHHNSVSKLVPEMYRGNGPNGALGSVKYSEAVTSVADC